MQLVGMVKGLKNDQLSWLLKLYALFVKDSYTMQLVHETKL